MTSLEIKRLIDKSGDTEVCEEVLDYTKELLKEANINITEPQWLSLVSHLSAMVERSINKEFIKPLDQSLFAEVSSQSLDLASEICGKLDHLHEDEKYLLSIHFESARMNG